MRDGSLPGATRDARGGWRLPREGLVAAGLLAPSVASVEASATPVAEVAEDADESTGEVARLLDEVVVDLRDRLTREEAAREEARRMAQDAVERAARAEATAQAAVEAVERERVERAREVEREREEAARLREEVGRLRARNDELTGALLREVAGRRPEGGQEHPGTVAVREVVGEEALDAEVVDDGAVEEASEVPEEAVEAPETPVERSSGAWHAVREWFRRR
ncbi:hypothetical protein [Kineococcus arenarius]|uniref:hypothetical protein n=1 Tax=unclassified Kineococcus TaxID=2621656 RepID=UPI003D7EE5AA